MEKGICNSSYGVGRLPGLKKVALYRSCGPDVKTVAWFNNEDEARDFMMFVDRLARISGNTPESQDWHGWAEVYR